MEKESGTKRTSNAKRQRKTRARSSRGKSSSTRGRFGIRYLHHHMFREEATSEKCPYVECKCGNSMAAVYSGKSVIVLTASVLVLLIGVTFMLVGYLIPRRSVVYLERGDGSRSPMDSSAITFNNMLDDFTLIGTILISLGALMFCVLLLVPICKASNRKGEYYQAPTEETQTTQAHLISAKNLSGDTTAVQAEDLRKFGTGAGASAVNTIDKIPVLALVHNVQPQQKPAETHSSSSSSRTKEYRKRRAEKYKDSFEEESED